jgi:hypothetical protein
MPLVQTPNTPKRKKTCNMHIFFATLLKADDALQYIPIAETRISGEGCVLVSPSLPIHKKLHRV